MKSVHGVQILKPSCTSKPVEYSFWKPVLELESQIIATNFSILKKDKTAMCEMENKVILF